MNGTPIGGALSLTIVMSASTLPAHADDRVPRFVHDQASAFAEQGATVHLLAPHAPASHGLRWPLHEAPRLTQWRFRYAPRRLEVLTDHGIMPALRERPWMLLVVPALMIAQFFALWALVRRVRPDVIYAHWFTPQAVTACVVAWMTLTPFGFTTHASDVAVWRRFGGLGLRIVRAVTARAAFVTAVSTQTAEKLRSFLDFDDVRRLDERIKIIPMGIDLANSVSTHRNPRRAVIVARFVEKKGIDVLLNAWPAVVASVPDARLSIAGAGPDEGHYRTIIRDRRLKIDMPGYVAGEAKAQLLASAGVVVQPSVVARDGDSDGLPVALLEGIAAGCIPVASDASGAQDIIETGRQGFITPAGDAPALATAIIAAMTLPDERRRSMLDAGQELIRRLTWPQVARKHLDLLAAAATSRGIGTPPA